MTSNFISTHVILTWVMIKNLENSDFKCLNDYNFDNDDDYDDSMVKASKEKKLI